MPERNDQESDDKPEHQLQVGMHALWVATSRNFLFCFVLFFVLLCLFFFACFALLFSLLFCSVPFRSVPFRSVPFRSVSFCSVKSWLSMEIESQRKNQRKKQ